MLSASSLSGVLDDVVIIGAGLAGTALALALVQNAKSSSIRIYESRSPTSPGLASGVVLTPNGLRVLDWLGVFQRIRHECWKGTHRTYKNDNDETTKKTLIAGEQLYGYSNHRVWRAVLLNTMREMLAEEQYASKVKIIYQSRFEGVVFDRVVIGGHDSIVKFMINGREERASLLVGADGIYSSVRKYLDPVVMPEYTGVTGVIGHINWNTVNWPYEDYERACTIQGKPGAIFFIPEVEDGSEIMVGMQTQIPDRSRTEWEDMQRDKDRLCEFYRKDYDEWGDTARSIIDSVCQSKDLLYAWPFLRMPKLQRWYSDTGHVLLVGDAAHAVPPSSGQGVNQSLEDVWSLTLLLRSGRELTSALSFWQKLRQERIDAVYDWATNANNVQRLPAADRERLIAEGKLKGAGAAADPDDMGWLYRSTSEDEINAWVQMH